MNTGKGPAFRDGSGHRGPGARETPMGLDPERNER